MAAPNKKMKENKKSYWPQQTNDSTNDQLRRHAESNACCSQSFLTPSPSSAVARCSLS